MRVAELMTPNPTVVGPQDSVRHAAELMARRDVGALPVCEGGRLVGLVSDRDIVDRAVAAGRAPDRTPVAQVMTQAVRWATVEDDPRAAQLLMADLRVGRLPVMDCQQNLVGLVSRGDLAAAGEEEAGSAAAAG
jgi:CBS domain-containing protein